jgi:16S rRNA (guanine966-N2)-methyltransferase
VPSKNDLRIIGGTWRSRRLHFFDSPKIRPTPDRVRETLFNWLNSDLNGAVCLDLFAGSGALGFEAISRGAKEAVLVEEDSRIATMLSQQKEQFDAESIEVKNQSALTYLQNVDRPFDIIFLDPPFDSQLLEEVIPMIIKQQVLSDNGLLYVETSSKLKGDNVNHTNLHDSGERQSEAVFNTFKCIREKSAGEVHYSLYKIC